MTDQFQVSVLICAYNAEGTIGRAIMSALRQTAQPREILVVDDGSTDNTRIIVSELAASYPSLRLIIQGNKGVSYCRNLLMDQAIGTHCAFLDADDVWYADHLSILSKMFAAEPDLAVAFSSALISDPKSTAPARSSRTPAGPISRMMAFSGNPCTTCSTMVIRKTAFAEIGPFATGLDHAEDQEWILRAVLKDYKISCSGSITTIYTTSPSGQSSALERMYAGFCEVRKAARRVAPEFEGKNGAEAEARICLYLARRAARLGQSYRTAFGYIVRALRADITIIAKSPITVAGTFAMTAFGNCGPYLRRPFLSPVKRET